MDDANKKSKLPATTATQTLNLPTQWTTNPYISAATSQNTRKAYRSDIRHYEKSGGKLPADPQSIIIYLQTFAATLNPRTLSRRLVSLKHWHTYQGFADPTTHPLVNKTMQGITRTHGKPKIKALPLTPDHLENITTTLTATQSLSAIRDSALLQIGFFGALRRSELVNICYEHIQWESEGIRILLPTSKTDQNNEGQYCAIPFGSDSFCPIKALKLWLDNARIATGPIFRRVMKNGTISNKALSPLSVNHIIQRAAKQAKLANAHLYSAHSLRRGLATSAALSNTPIHIIMRAGRWKQVNTVIEYIEASQQFSENAAASVLKNMRKETAQDQNKTAKSIIPTPPDIPA
jgi:integrase